MEVVCEFVAYIYLPQDEVSGVFFWIIYWYVGFHTARGIFWIRQWHFLSRTLLCGNKLPADGLGTLSCKPSNFRKNLRKVINKAKWRCGGNHPKMQWSEVKWSEVKRVGVKGSKLWWGCEGYVSVVKWNEGKVIVKYESSVHDLMYFITVTV
jgi:hypothetical protein